jgi:hypothetical protein
MAVRIVVLLLMEITLKAMISLWKLVSLFNSHTRQIFGKYVTCLKVIHSEYIIRGTVPNVSFGGRN